MLGRERFAVAHAARCSGLRGSIEPDRRGAGEAMTGVSWRRGCPVALRDLRLLTLSPPGLRRATRARAADRRTATPRAALVAVFRRLYAARFPIRRMEPVDAYGGERLPLDRGRQHLGVQLPLRRRVDALVEARLRPRDRRQPDREPVRQRRARRRTPRAALPRPHAAPAGMAVEGGALVRAFDARRLGLGRPLGGRVKDYQHFSESGR